MENTINKENVDIEENIGNATELIELYCKQRNTFGAKMILLMLEISNN